MTPDMHDALHRVGTAVVFAEGDVLRERGAFAPDVLLITSGRVDCLLSDLAGDDLSMGPGTIVGEIGFLTGQGATATLRAASPVEALSLDAEALQKLRRNEPAVAAEVLRHLAQLLQERAAQNNKRADTAPTNGVIRCSTLDQQRTAQRVRYDVECLENGLMPQNADDEEGLITDDLDRDGTSFIAIDGMQAVGMMRVNFDACGTAEITACAVRAADLTDALIAQFIQAIRTFAEASGARELRVRCAPDQDALYLTQGFQRVAPSQAMILPLGGTG